MEFYGKISLEYRGAALVNEFCINASKSAFTLNNYKIKIQQVIIYINSCNICSYDLNHLASIRKP